MSAQNTYSPHLHQTSRAVTHPRFAMAIASSPPTPNIFPTRTVPMFVPCTIQFYFPPVWFWHKDRRCFLCWCCKRIQNSKIIAQIYSEFSLRYLRKYTFQKIWPSVWRPHRWLQSNIVPLSSVDVKLRNIVCPWLAMYAHVRAPKRWHQHSLQRTRPIRTLWRRCAQDVCLAIESIWPGHICQPHCRPNRQHHHCRSVWLMPLCTQLSNRTKTKTNRL